MIVKKFQGETEKDAILKAQEELGNNAVVLNVKTIKQRGILKLFKKDVVEVTAALEEEELSKKANTGAKSLEKLLKHHHMREICISSLIYLQDLQAVLIF